jgi:hypothetical protein
LAQAAKVFAPVFSMRKTLREILCDGNGIDANQDFHFPFQPPAGMLPIAPLGPFFFLSIESTPAGYERTCSCVFRAWKKPEDASGGFSDTITLSGKSAGDA